MDCRPLDVDLQSIRLLLCVSRSVRMGIAGSQSGWGSAASFLRGGNSYLRLLQNLPQSGEDACAGVGCVAIMLPVGLGAQCCPSPGMIARRCMLVPTVVGPCPTIAVADADPRTISSTAT